MKKRSQSSEAGAERRDHLEVVCFGEVLWDSVPQGLFLGGAPFNVAAHLKQLGVAAGVVSSVGPDVLGAEILRRAESFGLPADLIQRETDLPTGFVDVTVEAGSPSYVIREPAAWDDIRWTDVAERCVGSARAFVFGTLAQRLTVTRQTLRHLLSVAPLAVLDVNLRPPFDDGNVISESWQAADIVKLNDAELLRIAGIGDRARTDTLRTAATQLADRYDVATVVITRGADGASMLHGGSWFEVPSDPITVVDTIGAGDAFLAGFLSQWLANSAPLDALGYANRLGGLVASRAGAIPKYDAGLI